MNGSSHVSSPVKADGLDIWEFSADVSDRLLLLNIANIAAGLVVGKGAGFRRGLASQNIGWGIINIGIAVVGKRATHKRYESLDKPFAPARQARETRNFRLILAGNGLLDLLYMFGGLRFARAAKTPMRRGIGVGIFIQGALLFAFDWAMLRGSLGIQQRDTADRRLAPAEKALI